MASEIQILKKEIKKEKARIAEAKEADDLRIEKRKLVQELSLLRRSPKTKYRADALSRFIKGARKVGGAVGKATIKQAKLIKEQQIREERKRDFLERKQIKKVKATKKKISKRRKTTKKLTKPKSRRKTKRRR